jgi:hypothetical protein
MVQGKIVMLLLPATVAAAGSSNPIYNDTALPVGVRPTSSQNKPVMISDNSVYAMGECYIRSDGILLFYKNVASDNFTNAGNCGFKQQTIEYRLN